MSIGNYIDVRGVEKKSTNLVECWCENRHEESIVDVAHQLVSDIRVGHLGTANINAHVSQMCSEVEGCSYLSRVNKFFMWQSHYACRACARCYLNNSVAEFQ